MRKTTLSKTQLINFISQWPNSVSFKSISIDKKGITHIDTSMGKVCFGCDMDNIRITDNGDSTITLESDDRGRSWQDEIWTQITLEKPMV